jgi:hypothetical protein
METIIIVFLMLVAIDIAALRWGFDSRDEIDSEEWIRRRVWKAFH